MLYVGAVRDPNKCDLQSPTYNWTGENKHLHTIIHSWWDCNYVERGTVVHLQNKVWRLLMGAKQTVKII